MRLVKLLANLGYGSRKEMQQAIRNGWVTDKDGNTLKADSRTPHEEIRFDDEPLDPAHGVVILMNKPVGYTCSIKDQGRLVYDLMPDRYRMRKPALSSIGRLDKETSGALLFTDDGTFLHQVISPKAEVPKVYEVVLDRPMNGDEGVLFASGSMMLENEVKPLKPAKLEVINETHARVILYEGRYHQVRRMFAAAGNHVVELRRSQVGALRLEGLEDGTWKVLSDTEKALIFA